MPYTPSRRAHQCHRDGCDSEAQWGVKLTFLCQGQGIYRQRMTCDATTKVCGKHCDAAMQYVLSPRNRDQIAKWLDANNLPPADFASAQFEFTRVDHIELENELIERHAEEHVQ